MAAWHIEEKANYNNHLWPKSVLINAALSAGFVPNMNLYLQTHEYWYTQENMGNFFLFIVSLNHVTQWWRRYITPTIQLEYGGYNG